MGGGGGNSLLNLIYYFSVSGDSKQKKLERGLGHFVVGTFLTSPLTRETFCQLTLTVKLA